MVVVRGLTMLDAELLRAICKELIAEKDLENLQELLSLLCAVVDDDEEEIRAKIPLLLERYPSLKEHSPEQKSKLKPRAKGRGSSTGGGGQSLPS